MSNRGPTAKPKQIPPGEAYANFANSLRTRPTLTTYLYCLKQYMAFRKLDNLDYLISKDGENTKLAETRVKEFILSVKSRGVTAGHINTNFNAIKHFYSMNDVLMNWRK